MHISSLDLTLVNSVSVVGKIVAIYGTTIRAKIPNSRIGELVAIDSGSTTKLAKVVSYIGDEVILSVYSDISEITPGSRIRKQNSRNKAELKNSQLGCIIDAFGVRISKARKQGIRIGLKDNCGELNVMPKNLLERKPIKQKLLTGISAIDTFLTLGQGQRIILLAEPGVGKTSLLISLANNAAVDLVIFALIGERGREITELYDDLQASQVLDRTIIVASTSDQQASIRAEAANTAMRLAELASDQGLNVLLAFDSLTRYLRALRDISLSSGEIPVRRGYPSSVFENIPRLIERAGNFEKGSITAIYTMLASTEIDEDPFVEEVKGLTDGHIILSRALSEQGHFPAIDIRKSLSRLQTRFWPIEMQQMIVKIKKAYCEAQDIEELLLISQNIEAYQHSKEKLSFINDFLYPQNNMHNEISLDEKIKKLYAKL